MTTTDNSIEDKELDALLIDFANHITNGEVGSLLLMNIIPTYKQAIQSHLKRAELRGRLDELIWATGAKISEEDLPAIQRRIAGLQAELAQLSKETL